MQVVVMAILAVFPLPLRGISDRGYRFSLAGSVVACAHCLYLNNRVQMMLSYPLVFLVAHDKSEGQTVF